MRSWHWVAGLALLGACTRYEVGEVRQVGAADFALFDGTPLFMGEEVAAIAIKVRRFAPDMTEGERPDAVDAADRYCLRRGQRLALDPARPGYFEPRDQSWNLVARCTRY